MEEKKRLLFWFQKKGEKAEKGRKENKKERKKNPSGKISIFNAENKIKDKIKKG
jgi:hypothetical protein